MKFLSVFIAVLLIGCSSSNDEVEKLNKEIADLKSQLAICSGKSKVEVTTTSSEDSLKTVDLISDELGIEKDPINEDGNDVTDTGEIDHFGSGGSDGEGDANNGIGSTDDGEDSGSGDNSDPNAATRYIVSPPDFTGISAKNDASVKLKLSIDAKGNVVYVENLSKISATVNQVLINNVKSIVKSEAKYNPAKGADVTKVNYTAKITAP